MQNILSRELINPDIRFQGFGVARPKTYMHFCHRINQVKHLLLNKGFEKGDMVGVVNLTCSFDSISILFALFELGAVTHVSPDILFDSPELDGFAPDAFNYRYHKIDREFRLTEMNDEINSNGAKATKGDLWNGAGKKWQNGPSISDNLMLIEYSEIDGWPTEDIQPWEVYENDCAVLYELHGWNKWMTQGQMITKARNCIDIFGFRDKKVGLTKSQHHRSGWEHAILPALMSAKRAYELPIPDKEPIKQFYQPITELSSKFIIRYGVELVYGVNEDVIKWIHNHFDMDGVEFVNAEFTYGEIFESPKCV